MFCTKTSRCFQAARITTYEVEAQKLSCRARISPLAQQQQAAGREEAEAVIERKPACAWQLHTFHPTPQLSDRFSCSISSGPASTILECANPKYAEHQAGRRGKVLLRFAASNHIAETLRHGGFFFLVFFFSSPPGSGRPDDVHLGQG